MKCQHCGKLEANFHYSSNINGSITEHHLCADCAETLGYNNWPEFRPEAEFESMFRDILGSSRGLWPMFCINMPGFVSAPPQMGILTENRPRPVSSSTIPDTGVTVDEAMKKRREVNILREQMHQAAEREDFERAIALRDEIRKYES